MRNPGLSIRKSECSWILVVPRVVRLLGKPEPQ